MTKQAISGQQQGESIDNITHDLLETSEGWNKRSAVHNAGFIQRYEEGKVQILLQFSAGFVSEEYVAVFQGKAQVGNGHYPRVRFRRFWEHLGIQARQMNAEITASDGDRQTVFVDNAEAVQAPQGITLTSSVWFNRAERIYSVLPHTFYLSKSFGLITRGCLDNRKVDLASSIGIGSEPESASHVVQRGSEALDRLTSDGRDERVNWLNVRDAIPRSALRINLADGFVWPTLQEADDFGIQICDVMVGPCQFDAN